MTIQPMAPEENSESSLETLCHLAGPLIWISIISHQINAQPLHSANHLPQESVIEQGKQLEVLSSTRNPCMAQYSGTISTFHSTLEHNQHVL